MNCWNVQCRLSYCILHSAYMFEELFKNIYLLQEFFLAILPLVNIIQFLSMMTSDFPCTRFDLKWCIQLSSTHGLVRIGYRLVEEEPVEPTQICTRAAQYLYLFALTRMKVIVVSGSIFNVRNYILFLTDSRLHNFTV